MWVSIFGAAGTGKHEIKDLLVREDYEYLEIREPSSTDMFERQYQFLWQRFSIHLQAQEMMDKHDIVTIGTVWDNIEVHYKMLTSVRGILTKEQCDLLDYAHEIVIPRLKSPHSVIWTYTETMTAFNRMSLRNKITVTPDEYNQQLARYKEFALKIRVPLIEIDFGQPMDRIIKDFEFNLASLRTTAVTAQSLWTREFLR